MTSFFNSIRSKTVMESEFKLLLLGLLLISGQMFAQLPNFTLTVNSTPETCLGNGSLSWTTSGTVAGSTLVYDIYLSPNFSTPIVTTSSNSLTGLSSGSYRVIATQTLGPDMNSAIANTTIDNHLSALGYTVSNTPELCGNDGSITVNITSGTPSTYSIIAGPVLVGSQASNVFTSLPGGNYTISVTDVCGNIQNYSNVIVNSYPSYKLDVNGHTDSQGDDTKNLLLSQKRAEAVEKYLVTKGIDESRLNPKGYGETMPKASNDTPAGRAENRRVEFVVKF